MIKLFTPTGANDEAAFIRLGQSYTRKTSHIECTAAASLKGRAPNKIALAMCFPL